MTILEFIRKNSALVLIVIVGVGAGLVMMDYSGKGSAFSRDFYIRVNNTGYSYPEAATLGENGKEFLSSLFSATRQLTEPFDADGNGQFDQQEEAALNAWLREHPEVNHFYGLLNDIYSGWTYGVAHEDSVNVAINRALIKAEGEALGLRPSEEQIDSYLRSMPAFQLPDGTFNKELYQRLAGYRRGNANRVQEEAFRDVIADMITWEGIQALVDSGVSYNTKAQLALIDAFSQSVSGRTAWLAAESIPTPDDPSEDELKAYWEEHKDAYKSEERRIISVYTLTPGQDSNMENLLYTADALMQDLSQANGQGLDKLLAEAVNNPEYDPFTYTLEDGSTHKTYALSTQAELQQALTDVVNSDGEETPLAKVAFSEAAGLPTPAEYEAMTAAGTPEQQTTIRQIRGFYTSTDGKLKLIRIEAVEEPALLPYEEAREQALADFKEERAAHALENKAHELYDAMLSALPEKGLKGAFELAAEAGAVVDSFGPVELGRVTDSLPSGVTDADVLGTPSGKLTPLVVMPDGARITSITQRTVVDTPALSMQKRLITLPMENTRLRRSMMFEWLNSAYSRYNVELSTHVRTRGAE